MLNKYWKCSERSGPLDTYTPFHAGCTQSPLFVWLYSVSSVETTRHSEYVVMDAWQADKNTFCSWDLVSKQIIGKRICKQEHCVHSVALFYIRIYTVVRGLAHDIQIYSVIFRNLLWLTWLILPLPLQQPSKSCQNILLSDRRMNARLSLKS